MADGPTARQMDALRRALGPEPAVPPETWSEEQLPIDHPEWKPNEALARALIGDLGRPAHMYDRSLYQRRMVPMMLKTDRYFADQKIRQAMAGLLPFGLLDREHIKPRWGESDWQKEFDPEARRLGTGL